MGVPSNFDANPSSCLYLFLKFLSIFKYQYLASWFVTYVFLDQLKASSKCVCYGLYMQVHDNSSDDVGVKVDRPVDEVMAEAPAELVGA